MAATSISKAEFVAYLKKYGDAAPTGSGVTALDHTIWAFLSTIKNGGLAAAVLERQEPATYANAKSAIGDVKLAPNVPVIKQINSAVNSVGNAIDSVPKFLETVTSAELWKGIALCVAGGVLLVIAIKGAMS